MKTAFLALLLSGTAVASDTDLPKPAVAGVERITLLAVRDPFFFEVRNIGGAAGAFGILGGVAQEASNIDHAKDFHAALDERKLSLSAPLQAALLVSLRQDGYRVEVDAKQWPGRTADGKRDDFSGVHVGGDAVLIAKIILAGFRSTPMSVHYRPELLVSVRLLGAKAFQDLYAATIGVGEVPSVHHVIRLPTNSRVRFGTFDDLMAHLDAAAASLVDDEGIAAGRVGADLAK
jgi:hypothetical protein